MADSLPVMLTIREAKSRFPGTSEHALRQFVLSGELPAVRCGKKYLICEQVLRDFLMRGNNQTIQPEQAGKIRRLG